EPVGVELRGPQGVGGDDVVLTAGLLDLEVTVRVIGLEARTSGDARLLLNRGQLRREIVVIPRLPVERDGTVAGGLAGASAAAAAARGATPGHDEPGDTQGPGRHGLATSEWCFDVHLSPPVTAGRVPRRPLGTR